MNIAELINNTLKEAQELMTSKTVVGEPIRTDTHTVIPVSKVMFGFGGGGGEPLMVKALVVDGQSNQSLLWLLELMEQNL